MNKNIKTYLQYIFFLAVGIFLVWWQFSSMNELDKANFYHALKTANYWLVVPVVGMSLLSHLSRAMRWKLLMKPLGYDPALKNVFAVTMLGYLANLFVPRVGEILKCTFLAREEHLKVDKLVGTIIVERIFDFICFIVFIALTVLIQMEKVGEFFGNQLNKMSAAPGLPLWVKAILAILAIGAMVRFVHYLMKRYPNNRLFVKADHFFKGVANGFTSVKKLKERKLFLLHTLMIWSMYLLQVYVGFFAFSGTANLTIQAACSVLTLASLAMIATPGGTGSFPIFVMQTLGIYGIQSSTGIAFGWLMWGVSTAIVLLVGSISLIYLLLIDKKRNENYSGNTNEDIFTD